MYRFSTPRGQIELMFALRLRTVASEIQGDFEIPIYFVMKPGIWKKYQ